MQEKKNEWRFISVHKYKIQKKLYDTAAIEHLTNKLMLNIIARKHNVKKESK